MGDNAEAMTVLAPLVPLLHLEQVVAMAMVLVLLLPAIWNPR